MRKQLLLALVILLPAPVLAQTARPDFSGAWELVVAKSDFGKTAPPKKVTLAIRHREPQVNVRTTMSVQQGDLQSDANYTTGGGEDTNSDQGVTTKTRSRWEKNQLVIQGHVLVQKQIINMQERWSLADQGQTFVNERTLFFPSGTIAQKLVYTRVGGARKK